MLARFFADATQHTARIGASAGARAGLALASLAAGALAASPFAIWLFLAPMNAAVGPFRTLFSLHPIIAVVSVLALFFTGAFSFLAMAMMASIALAERYPDPAGSIVTLDSLEALARISLSGALAPVCLYLTQSWSSVAMLAALVPAGALTLLFSIWCGRLVRAAALAWMTAHGAYGSVAITLTKDGHVRVSIGPRSES